MFCPLCSNGCLRSSTSSHQRAPEGHSAYVCMPSLSVGQKPTCGRGLEGPWERPPPLDEPQRDGNSEDQVEGRATLSGELWSVGWGGGWEPHGPSLALSPLYLSFRAWRGTSASQPPLSLAHKLRALYLPGGSVPQKPTLSPPSFVPCLSPARAAASDF